VHPGCLVSGCTYQGQDPRYEPCSVAGQAELLSLEETVLQPSTGMMLT
jgi:hypothetical protein